MAGPGSNCCGNELLRIVLIVCLAWLASKRTQAADEAPSPAKFNKAVRIGQQAPDWRDLPGVDGQRHALSDYSKAKVLVLVFLANHCPMSAAYEKRLMGLAAQGPEVQVVAVCVSQNEADNLARMQERARERKFNFPYLYDASQKTGRDLGALATPHVFVFDRARKIAYMGAFDDQLDEAQVERHLARQAVEQLLAGKPVETAESRPRGCAIEYAERD